jgi:hypothetical protein
MRPYNGTNEADGVGQEIEAFLASTEIKRLSKDLRVASKLLTSTEARYLVDAYYTIQEVRKRFANQERALEASGEPHEMISHLTKQWVMLEGQIKMSLDVYSFNHPVGSWLRGNKGIGPVISAGLIAHIDINKAKTYGHIWRYAGLDPTVKWYGRGIVEVIKAARKAEDGDWEALLWIGKAINTKPTSILIGAGLMEQEALLTPEQALAECYNRIGHEVECRAVLHSDNIVKELIADDERADFYRTLYPDVKINWTKIGKSLARRPWNSDLKTLCWKIGDSFKKVSGVGEGKHPSPYGLLYRERKAAEVEKNDSGQFAETALNILKEKNIGKDKDAYWWYSGEWVRNPKMNPEVAAAVELTVKNEGVSEAEALKLVLSRRERPLKPKLSPSHIDARAMRFAVKIFLSHLHNAMYKRVLKKNPPVPYSIAHMNHIHMIEPFHFDEDIIDGEIGADDRMSHGGAAL